MPSRYMGMPSAVIVSALSLLQPWLRLTTIPSVSSIPAPTAGKIAVVFSAIPAWEKVF